MVNKIPVKKLGSWATPSAWQMTVSMEKTRVINSPSKILWGWLSFHINNKGMVRTPSAESMKVIGIDGLSKLHQ